MQNKDYDFRMPELLFFFTFDFTYKFLYSLYITLIIKKSLIYADITSIHMHYNQPLTCIFLFKFSSIVIELKAGKEVQFYFCLSDKARMFSSIYF